jgi:peptidoglycan/LPS O-acetylase OafA/YrhL
VGVDIFFVISGFLITTLMLRERERTGGLNVRGFYARRLFRIVPAYVALLVTVLVLTMFGAAQLGARDWVAATTYTVNFLHKPAWEVGHAWSLSIEEHFYLAWPLLMAAALPLARRAALACLALCFGLRWVILLAFPQYTQMAELWTFTRIDAIATGCVLAFLACDPRWRARLDRLSDSNLTLLAVGLCLAGSLALSASAKFGVGVAYSLNAVCIAILLWAAVRRSGSRVGRILNHWTLQSIGVASYSLYLWQQLFLDHGQTGFVHRFPQNVVFAVIAAVLSYRLIERPFLALKQPGTVRRGPAEAPAPCWAGLDTVRPPGHTREAMQGVCNA